MRRGGRIVGGAYARADRVIDRGQHHVLRVLWFFLPDTSIAKSARFQQIMVSRFFSDAGSHAVTYGALIAIVRSHGSAIDAAFVGVAALVPAAIFGLYGGAVADALPKRIALAAAYGLQAVLCFAIPAIVGTNLPAVLFLIFAVHTLGQVSSPTESSVVAFVASEEQLASAASLVSLSSNAGVGFGTAVLAPVLVRVFDEKAAFYTAGVMLLIAASRVFDLTTAHQRAKLEWRRSSANARATVRWIAHERAVATMIAVSVLAGTTNLVIQMLGPRYVQTVLHVDPANSVYVFAPTAVGLVAALVVAPPLIGWRGERAVALGGFFISTAVLFLLGFVGRSLADIVDPVNPLRALLLFDIHLSDDLRTAGALAILLGFGLSMTTTAVHTYINRRVPLAYQGRAFALQSTLKNGATIVPLLTLGLAAEAFGVDTVLAVSPVLLFVIAVALVQLSFVFGGPSPHQHLDVLTTFWQESVHPVTTPDDLAPTRGGDAR
jgi:MFS family permease